MNFIKLIFSVAIIFMLPMVTFAQSFSTTESTLDKASTSIISSGLKQATLYKITNAQYINRLYMAVEQDK
ncbi:hypothetical protein M2263_001945 [Providencia alcalifaciens]|nr:hypothetical protein [Providencia alcalifaciens]